MAVLSRSAEIAAFKERIDELERSEADLRASVETLQREVSEREEILEIMVRGEEGNEFVEKEEIREDLEEYSGDFTGATVPEGLDPGVPEVEDMALPLSGNQEGIFESLSRFPSTCIVEYLKKQVGPASFEIKSSDDASKLIDGKKVFIVGVFSEFSGKEYENFMDVAKKLLSDYDFGHTSDAKLLPHGDSAVKHPKVRLFKPFDELLVDTQDFQVDALERFIEVSSVPVVTLFNKDPSNHPYVIKFFNNPNEKVRINSSIRVMPDYLRSCLFPALPIPSLFPFLYFMIRDLQVAKRVEDVGFYAGFVALSLTLFSD
ncbi:hypothetical protein J5N97_029791 [Dioscorea zingiberensis]|uniref:protein disulfide-isomerase n=1 Tax=Dioscorea zingiberensis TaxID=325984 RepID=A0A9D5BWD7_9LILI|nr:hypothetical protein J5N97_029791 [Dioscorea zingiberensis]